MANNPNDRQRRDLLQEIELINQRIAEANRASATATGAELTRLQDIVEQNRIILQLQQDQLDTLDSMQNKVKKNLTNFDNLDDTLVSIGSTLQGNSELQDKFNSKLNSAKNTLTSISNIVDVAGFDDRQLRHIDNAGRAYQDMNVSIANAAAGLHNNTITQQQYNEIVQRSFEQFDSLVALIDTSTEAGQDLVETFRQGRVELEGFERAAQRSAAAVSAMEAATEQLGSSGIPLAREFSGVLEDIAKNGKLGKLALIALGAAAGKLAFDYFGAPFKAGIKASNDIKENQIEGAKNVAKAQSDLTFAAKEAAQDFSFQLQQMAAQFNAASKTALFGKGLGSVGYAASQLQLAGISAETIANATTAASKAGSGSPKLAADMAIFAERSGISVDNLANVQQAFKLLDGVSASTALNMVEGTRAMAEQAGLNVGDVMNEIASASEMALNYQIRSGEALARQVVYAKSLGVSFSEVAKAGQNMVLNYKDSIKAEMSLSAMLGKNVNLSEVRAKFMSGDDEGALKALQAQGLKPSEMNMFQKQQLQAALGGMDLNALEKIATPGYQEGVGKVGKLEEKSAKTSNEAFLALKQSAESALKTQEAMIAGQKAVADAALATMKEAAWLNSQSYVDYLAAIAQLDIERQFTENAGGAAAAAAGGLIGNFLPDIAKFFKGGGPGVKGALTGPMSKMAKVGGAGLSGVIGGVSGFMDKKAEGGTTGEAVGAGVLQGALGAGGAALGAAFGGPLGMMVGGFLGNTLGGWINDNFPQVSARFGGVWDKMTSKFTAIGEKFQPVIKAIDGFLSKIGFEGGLGEVFYAIGEALVNTVIAPFEILVGVFGFLFDIVGAVGQLLSGDFSGAWNTLKNGFIDLMKTVFGPFEKVFVYIYNGFASMWNWLSESFLGQALGLGKMEMKSLPVDSSVAKEVADSQAEANQPVVEGTKETAKHAKETTVSVDRAGNIMNEVVAMLAVNATLLQEVVANTAGERVISLDGKKVNTSLLESSRKNYGIGKVP